MCAAVLERSDGELEGAAGDVDVVVLDAHLQQNFMLRVPIHELRDTFMATLTDARSPCGFPSRMAQS